MTSRRDNAFTEIVKLLPTVVLSQLRRRPHVVLNAEWKSSSSILEPHLGKPPPPLAMNKRRLVMKKRTQPNEVVANSSPHPDPVDVVRALEEVEGSDSFKLELAKETSSITPDMPFFNEEFLFSIALTFDPQTVDVKVQEDGKQTIAWATQGGKLHLHQVGFAAMKIKKTIKAAKEPMERKVYFTSDDGELLQEIEMITARVVWFLLKDESTYQVTCDDDGWMDGIIPRFKVYCPVVNSANENVSFDDFLWIMLLKSADQLHAQLVDDLKLDSFQGFFEEMKVRYDVAYPSI
ncbi:hypothetical protein BSKO_02742 [Bryopsis sp. KO-2023]|nr:hypothetical protein BSKO_02742 [Bryopsis sp. KO-2023]